MQRMTKTPPPESSELFAQLRRTIPAERCPPEVAPMPAMLRGVCFFPGAAGVWGDAAAREYVPFPSEGAMIVGQDWGTVRGYNESAEWEWIEPAEATWDNLLTFLRETRLPPEKCFFTNFFPGLRKTEIQRTGEFPGARCERYAKLCGEFFLAQIAAAKPRLLVLLGVQIPYRVAALSEELKDWRDCKTMRALDNAGALKTKIRFGEHSVDAACWLVHPSYRARNVNLRRYENRRGDAAEIALIKDAMRESGILK